MLGDRTGTNSDRLPLVAIMLVTLLGISPFLGEMQFLGTSSHNIQRLIQVLTLSLLPILLIHHWNAKEWVLLQGNRWVASAISLFFVIGFVSSLLAYSVRNALLEWTLLLLLAVLGWVVAGEVVRSTRRSLHLLLLISAVGCLLYELNVLIIYLAALANGTRVSPYSFAFGFDNYRFFNHTQTISLPLLVLITALQTRGVWQHRVLYMVSAAWWSLLLVTGGRGTALGVFAGLLFTLFVRGRTARGWLREMIGTATTGAVLYALMFFAIPMALDLGHWGYMSSIVERSVANPTSSRWEIWNLAIQMMLDHPWLGAGPAHFAHLGPIVENGAHPHNWVLQIAAEWGVICVVLISAVVAVSLKALLQCSAEANRGGSESVMVYCALLTTGAAIIVDGLVSGLIVMPLSQLWIVLYIGLAWGWCSQSRKRPPVLQAPRSSAFRGAVALSLLLVLLWQGLVPEVFNLAKYEKEALNYEVYRNGVTRPRIWATGYF